MSYEVRGKKLVCYFQVPLRRERALALRELGELSGVTLNTIWRIEAGRQGAHPSTIRKLAEALGVDTAELVKGEE